MPAFTWRSRPSGTCMAPSQSPSILAQLGCHAKRQESRRCGCLQVTALTPWVPLTTPYSILVYSSLLSHSTYTHTQLQTAAQPATLAGITAAAGFCRIHSASMALAAKP